MTRPTTSTPTTKAMATMSPMGASYTRAMSFRSLATMSRSRSASVPGRSEAIRSRNSPAVAPAAGGEGDGAGPERRRVRQPDDGRLLIEQTDAVADGDTVLLRGRPVDDELGVGRRLPSVRQPPGTPSHPRVL